MSECLLCLLVNNNKLKTYLAWGSIDSKRKTIKIKKLYRGWGYEQIFPLKFRCQFIYSSILYSLLPNGY